MGRLFYNVVEWIDDRYFHHRYKWLCDWQDRHAACGPHKPHTLPYMVLLSVLLFVALGFLPEGRRYRKWYGR